MTTPIENPDRRRQQTPPSVILREFKRKTRLSNAHIAEVLGVSPGDVQDWVDDLRVPPSTPWLLDGLALAALRRDELVARDQDNDPEHHARLVAGAHKQWATKRSQKERAKAERFAAFSERFAPIERDPVDGSWWLFVNGRGTRFTTLTAARAQRDALARREYDAAPPDGPHQ